MDRQPRPGSLAARLSPAATVLVVEDDPDITTFLTAYFQASGVKVEHLAPDAADQVPRAVEQCRAGCVLLDLHLGRVSGYEVLELMGEADLLPGTPVLVLTADGRAEAAQRCQALGAVGVRLKPFNVKELYGEVADLLGVERR